MGESGGISNKPPTSIQHPSTDLLAHGSSTRKTTLDSPQMVGEIPTGGPAEYTSYEKRPGDFSERLKVLKTRNPE